MGAEARRFRSNEVLLITILGLCFGVCLLAVKLGYSVALGAFIIGAVIAEAREIGKIEHLMEPIRDMFSAIFFVTIGLLIDPRMLLAHWLPILVLTLVVIAGKIAACAFGAFVGGNDRRTSLRVGMSLAQIGEFSFIIAALGLSLKVTNDFLYPIAVAVSALTALATPYLIKSTDRWVNSFDRWAPRPLTTYLDLYTGWVGQLGGQGDTQLPGNLARAWSAQMVLNAALIGAIFLGAASLGRQPPNWMVLLVQGEAQLKALLWLAAVLLSLPLFMATFRKLQALGLLIAETRVSPAAAGENTAAIRTIIAQVIPLAGISALGLYGLLLTSALLPPLKVLIMMLVIVGLTGWLLRRSCVRVYSKAQVALRETLARRKHETPLTPKVLPAILREADLETITVAPLSSAAGKLIRELELRTRTGASIVGIQRRELQIINPGPDEEIQPGDQVLLLGTRAQLEAAGSALAATSPAAGV